MPRTARTKHARAEARQAVIGILSRPGTVDAMADEIFEVIDRIERGADAEPKPKCQNPDAPGGPHSGTDLVGVRRDGTGGHCPICGWSPDDSLTTAAT